MNACAVGTSISCLLLLAAPAVAATVSGVAWDDADADGVRGAGEVGWPDRILFLDLDFDGALDPGEPTTTTDASGAYRFVDVADGVHAIAELLPVGFQRTAPTGLALAGPIKHTTDGGPRSPVIADLDGDGVLDIATSNQRGRSISLLFGDGHGGFAPRIDRAAGTAPRRLVAAHLNRDAKLDLAVTNSNDDSVSVFLNAGAGTFPTEAVYPVGGGPFEMRVVDWDGDGDRDLVTVNLASSTMTRLANDGDGVFTVVDTSAVGASPHSITVADLDRDGHMDFVSSDLEASSITAFFGVAGGGIGPAQTLQVGAMGPIDTYAIDLDQDTHLDLVTSNLCLLCNQDEDISVLFGDGDGGFASPVTYTLGFVDSPHEIDFADLDGDGDLDLSLPGSDSGDVAVVLNQGLGVLGPPSLYHAGDKLIHVRHADLDADGDLDLVTAGSDSNDLTVLLNDGKGGFLVGYQARTGFDPRFHEIADLNGDGDEDIVTANQGERSISVFHNVLGERPVSIVGGADVTGVDFGSVRGIYADGFESGDPCAWSAAAPEWGCAI